METREELLNGLKDAVSIIGQLANIQQQLKRVRFQYRKISPNKKVGKLAIGFLILIIITIVIQIYTNGIINIIPGVINITSGRTADIKRTTAGSGSVSGTFKLVVSGKLLFC